MSSPRFPTWWPGRIRPRTSKAQAASPDRERLLELARAAERLKGNGDPKLLKAIPILKELIQSGQPAHRLLPLHRHRRIPGR